MRNCFIDRETRSILDLVPGIEMGFLEKGAMIITRIKVPHDHCRKGVGTRLLKEALAEADAHGVHLYLEIVPSGEMGFADLVKWYKKHGFVPTQYGEELMVRRPVKKPFTVDLRRVPTEEDGYWDNPESREDTALFDMSVDPALKED